jgi:hypothetical protein
MDNATLGHGRHDHDPFSTKWVRRFSADVARTSRISYAMLARLLCESARGMTNSAGQLLVIRHGSGKMTRQGVVAFATARSTMRSAGG